MAVMRRRGGSGREEGCEWWGGRLENDSLMGGTVDRRIGKGMSGKMEGGWQRNRDAGWQSGQRNG